MRASGSEIGRTIVRTIHMNAGHAFRLSAPGARASLECTVAEHRAIHEALVARDGELAASRTAAHIDSAWAERRNNQFALARRGRDRMRARDGLDICSSFV